MQEYFMYFNFSKLMSWGKRSANYRRQFDQSVLNQYAMPQ